MSYITWSDSLSVGNTFIDKDHRRLVELVNELHDAMTAGRGKEVVGKTLAALIQYTAEHFRREEDEMARINYGQSLTHKQEHKKLVTHVLELQKKFADGKTMLTVEVSKFLKEWLVNHIMKTDQDLAAAIKASR